MEQETGKNSKDLTIPKHRFDCVSLCLKETKQSLTEVTAEAATLRDKMLRLETALIKAHADRLLAEAGAKNIPAARALLDFSEIRLEQYDIASGIEEQITSLKKNHEFLFEPKERAVYVLTPLTNPGRFLASVQNLKKEVE